MLKTTQNFQEFFNDHSVEDCIEDLTRMYFHYSNDEDLEDALKRQTATETFFKVNHLLTCIKDNKTPEEVLFVQIPVNHC